MAIRNKRVFGLDVNVSLADVGNRLESLANLGLDIRDLELIRGISETGVSTEDLQCVSNLSRPIYRTFDRYISDTSRYNDILATSGGVDSQLQGNIDLAGGLTGSAIKFQKLEGDLTLNATTTLKWGDISTSRVSSWSSLPTGPVPASTDPILYGASVKIGGALSVGKLKTRQVPIPKVFDSEVATHKIKLNLNGTTRYVYAMKGIPLTFRGFFRNFDATIGLTGVAGSSRVSWRIVPLDGTATENFANIGTANNSTLQYRSPFSKERTIEIYFNPFNISSIDFPRVNISQVPNIRLTNLRSIDISSNQFREFPDLKFLGPNLETIEASFNNFFQSSVATERTFNQNVLAKIPTSVVSLSLRSCFYGSVSTVETPSGSLPKADLSSLTVLQTLNLSRNGTPYFYPDSNDPGNLPLVAPTVRNYYAGGNDFRLISIDDTANNKYSVQSLPNLVDLYINDNYNLVSSNFSVQSTAIQRLYISQTGLNIPNLQNRQFLTEFGGWYTRNAGSLFVGGSSKFSGCTALSSVNLYASAVSGQIPRFSTNKSLSYLELRYCNNLVAGRPDKVGDTKLLYNDTFTDCKNLARIYIDINNPSFAGEIESEAFSPAAPALSELMFIANGRAQGSFPNLNTCSKLTYLWSYGSGWTGNLPALSNSPSIYYIDLSYNRFGEGIPDASISYSDKRNLQFLYLNNNKLKQFSSSFSILPELRYLYVSSNEMTGTLPRFDLICSKLERLILNNNSFTGYTRGLDALYNLRIFDISNNNLSRSVVDSMLFDLVKNYNAARRDGVVVNLLGNDSPTPYPTILGLVSGVTNLTINKGSTEVLENKTYSNVSASGGSGSGATFNVSVTNGNATISVASAGRNYVAGQTLTISNIQTSTTVNGEKVFANNGSLTFNITTTTATDTTQFVGRAAVEYLRKQGWVVQTT
jgi:Leucine-rich repeat (LRR) protein